MDHLHIAMIPKGVDIPMGLLSRVAAAIQLQVMSEVQPWWAALGAPMTTVAAYPDDASAFGSTARVYIAGNAIGHAGYHVPENSTAAFAVVQYRNDKGWMFIASHEVAEMVVDLRGILTFPGTVPNYPNVPVRYLAEVCDPCQMQGLAYALPQFPDIPLSDFCLPAYYGHGSGRFDRCGALVAPFSLAAGGYSSFVDQHGQWYRYSLNGGQANIQPIALSQTTTTGGMLTNLRGALDRAREGYGGPPLKPFTRRFLKTIDPRTPLEKRGQQQNQLALDAKVRALAL